MLKGLQQLFDLAMEWRDAPKHIKEESDRLKSVIGLAMNLRQHRINMHSAPVGRHPHHRLTRVLILEKNAWKKLTIIDNEVGSCLSGQLPVMGRIRYTLMLRPGVDQRKSDIMYLESELSQELRHLENYV